MKKIVIVAFSLLLLTPALLKGQGQGSGFSQENEKLTAYKIAFFTQRLDLTPQEAERFWPLYNDYSARKTKLQVDRISLIQYFNKNEANMSEAELSTTADKLSRSFVEESELTVSFTGEVKKILSPAKVIRLYQCESMYKQHLLRELNQRRQGQGSGMRGGQQRNQE